MPFAFLKKQSRPKHILSDNDLIFKNSSPALSEALKAARINLMYSLSEDDAGKCVLITSASPAEGKTTSCINLAVSLAQTECRVLVIDADLRRPRIHKCLDVKNKEGLANYLGGFSELSSIVSHIEDLNLDVITAGNLPPNPTELLGSKKMQRLIETVKQEYDYILLDTPPVNVVADAMTLTQLVKNAVFVCRCGCTLTTEVKKALSALTFASAKILGFITIDAPQKKKNNDDNYSGYYYYQ